MEHVTLQNIINALAALIVVFNFIKWIISFANPIVEMKDHLLAHDKMLDNDKKHLEKVDKGIKRLDEGVSIIGRSMNELLKHEITGNDIQALKEQQRYLNNYFYNAKGAENEN